MSDAFLRFSDVCVEKFKLYCSGYPIDINKVNIEK